MRPANIGPLLWLSLLLSASCGDKEADTAATDPAGDGTSDDDAGSDGSGDGADGADGTANDGSGGDDTDGTDGSSDGDGSADGADGSGGGATDEDGDGVTLEEGDCDDADPTVYPGARDVCANGVDDDCDGTVDVPDCDGWSTCYADCLSDFGPSAWWRLGEASGAVTALDATGGGLDGTYNGLATGSLGIAGAIASDPDTALDLSGHSDWVEFGDIRDLGSGNISISLWLKTSETWGYVLGKSDPRTTDGRFGVGLSGARTTTANPAGVAFFLDAGTPPDTFYESTSTVADGAWHNVVFTFDRLGDATTYVDGVADGSWTTAGYAGVSFDTDSALVFGLLQAEYATTSDTDDGHPYNGALDEVAFFDRVLTADDVALLYGASQ